MGYNYYIVEPGVREIWVPNRRGIRCQLPQRVTGCSGASYDAVTAALHEAESAMNTETFGPSLTVMLVEACCVPKIIEFILHAPADVSCA